MSKLKKVLLMCTVYALVAVLAIGGTVAYLTDTDSAVNVMTVGNVNVELNEKQRDDNGKLEDFEQGKTLLPIVGGISEKDDSGMPTNPNYVDKIVYATNTGKNDAYIRILVAIPSWANTSDDTGANANNLHWNYPNDENMAKLQAAIGGDFSADSYTDWTMEYDATLETTIEIDGAEYGVFSFTMKDVVKAGESTPVVMTGAYLDSAVDYDADKGVYLDQNGNEIEGFDGTVYLPVFVEAVQAAGFTDADTALDTAFGEFTYSYNPWEGTKVPTVVSTADELIGALENGEDVVLNGDIAAEATTTAPYGNKVAFIQNGGVLDGSGNTLSVECSGDDYGIMTSGGTIKNLTIDSGCRAIMIMSPTGDIVVDNVNIGGDGVLYCINTGEAGAEGVKLSVTNSTLAGWTSYGPVVESASFTNVKFEQGEYEDYASIYGRVLKPYVNTTLTDCSFIEHMNLDLSSLTEGHKVTFVNCTVNGQDVTADVFTPYSGDDSVYDTALFSVDLPGWADSIDDCINFN